MATAQARMLQGVRVLDYSHFLAGPYLSRCLGGLGAEVIKVERPPHGDAGRAHPYMVDGVSGYFLQQNMGKQGLCLDLKKPSGMELMRKLVASADVFVENYRPGALTRLGLGYKALSAINPRLIYCSVSAYGHTGPDAAKPGFGLIAEAKSGAMAQLGEPGQAPPLLRMPIADMYTGAHGVAAVCAALFWRMTSGKGQHIDLSLYDCMVSMHDYAVQSYTMSGGRDIPVQVGHHLPSSTVYGVFSARDGYVVIAALADDSWQRLARLVGGDSLAADARFLGLANRNAHREAAVRLVQDWVSEQPSKAHCVAVLENADIPSASVQTIDEVVNDPQIAARGMIVEQNHPVLGPVRLADLPFRMSEADTSAPCPAPLLGQHNRSIASGLGYSGDEIDAMERDGVLYQEPAAAEQSECSAPRNDIR